jgi:pentose-5-phosphate-3-epimerase
MAQSSDSSSLWSQAAPHQLKEMLARATAKVKAASTAKEIATSRSATRGRDIRMNVDGGIKVNNIRRVAYTGADTVVAGSAIFRREGFSAVIGAMRAALEG